MKNLILILIVLSSCTPQKRFTRLVNKHPYLLTTDSVILTDTIDVIIPNSSIDTTILIKSIKDTVTLENDTIKVIVYKDGESIYIKGECKTDTVTKIIERTIPINHYKEVVKNKSNKWLWIIIAFLVLIVFIRR